jgi:hypothetical protein
MGLYSLYYIYVNLIYDEDCGNLTNSLGRPRFQILEMFPVFEGGWPALQTVLTLRVAASSCFFEGGVGRVGHLMRPRVGHPRSIHRWQHLFAAKTVFSRQEQVIEFLLFAAGQHLKVEGKSSAAQIFENFAALAGLLICLHLFETLLFQFRYAHFQCAPCSRNTVRPRILELQFRTEFLIAQLLLEAAARIEELLRHVLKSISGQRLLGSDGFEFQTLHAFLSAAQTQDYLEWKMKCHFSSNREALEAI